MLLSGSDQRNFLILLLVTLHSGKTLFCKEYTLQHLFSDSYVNSVKLSYSSYYEGVKPRIVSESRVYEAPKVLRENNKNLITLLLPRMFVDSFLNFSIYSYSKTLFTKF